MSAEIKRPFAEKRHTVTISGEELEALRWAARASLELIKESNEPADVKLRARARLLMVMSVIARAEAGT